MNEEPHPSRPADDEWELSEHVCYISSAAFERLPDYSCSMPTGVYRGKVWRRRIDYYDASKGWILGEYAIDPDNPEHVRLIWRDLVVVTPRKLQVRRALLADPSAA